VKFYLVEEEAISLYLIRGTSPSDPRNSQFHWRFWSCQTC